MSMSKKKLDPMKHLIAGTCAGLISTVALFPLDTIKVRYQVDETTSLASPKRIASAVKRIISVEGWRGLYQGLSAGLYGAGLAWGGYFFFYEQAKRRWLGDDETSSTFHHMAAAVEAGTVMVALTNPIWLVKVRMQLQLRNAESAALEAVKGQTPSPSVKPYKNFSDAIKTIVKDEGFFALYKGSIPALLLVSHGAVQFMVYEKLKASDNQRLAGTIGNEEIVVPPSTFRFLAMGAVAKIVASVATYPLQVVKARLQQRELPRASQLVDSTLVRGAHYDGVIDCVRRTWRHEGVYGFYKGCLPNALRVAPGAAITFFAYETIADALRT